MLPGQASGGTQPHAGHRSRQPVYGEKPGGLILDLLGLADQLADALAIYTRAGGKGEPVVRQVQDEAVPAMLEAFDKLRSFFHGSEYAQALNAKPQEVLPIYLRTIDHVFGQNDGWKTAADNGQGSFDPQRLADDTSSEAGHARQRDIDAP